MLKKFWNVFWTKQFLTFLFVGLLNVVNGIVVPGVLSYVMNPNIAYALSYLPNLFISYVLNSFFTFETKKLSIEKCIKFYISYIPNFIIQNVIFAVVYNFLALPRIIAVVLAAVIGLPVTFILLKIFAFKQERTRVDNG